MDLDWAQRHYFDDFIRQIQGIIGDPTLSIEIRNADAEPVAIIGPPFAGPIQHTRTFGFVVRRSGAACGTAPKREAAAVDGESRCGQ